MDCGTSCWQDIKGSDSVTGYSWALSNLARRRKASTFADTPVTPDTVNTYVFNEIQRVMGPRGQQTSVLYSEIRKRGGGATQTPYLLTPPATALQGDLYVSYWIKLQPDLLERLGSNSWRALFEWKTSAQQRLITYIYTDGLNKPYWDLKADDLSGGEIRTFWEIANHTAPVPVGEWFKFEFFWHRSSQRDGRAWQAVNGQVVLDHFGPLHGGNDPIDRIMLTQVYAGGTVPKYQWVDDIEVWDGFLRRRRALWDQAERAPMTNAYAMWQLKLRRVRSETILSAGGSDSSPDFGHAGEAVQNQRRVVANHRQ